MVLAARVPKKFELLKSSGVDLRAIGNRVGWPEGVLQPEDVLLLAERMS